MWFLERGTHTHQVSTWVCVYIYIPYECLSLTEINQFFKHLKDYTTHGNTHTPNSGIPPHPTSLLGDYLGFGITRWIYWFNDDDNSFNKFSFIHLAHLTTDKHCCCCSSSIIIILLWVLVSKKNKTKMWENKEE
jgi:hypothetical protein